MPSLVETGSVVPEKKIFKFVNVYSLFRNYLPMEKGGALHLNKLTSSGELKTQRRVCKPFKRKHKCCYGLMKFCISDIKQHKVILIFGSNPEFHLRSVVNFAFRLTCMSQVFSSVIKVSFYHFRSPESLR